MADLDGPGASRRKIWTSIRLLLLVGLIVGAALTLIDGLFGALVYLIGLAALGAPATGQTRTLFLVALYGPPVGLVAIIILAANALRSRSNRSLVAPVAVTIAVWAAITLVPVSGLPFQEGGQQLNILPVLSQNVGFPLRVREERRISAGAGSFGLAWSPDGSRLAARLNNSDSTIAIWDRTGVQLSRFDAPLGANYSNALAFVGNPTQLLLPASYNDESSDLALFVYDAASGRIVRKIVGPDPAGGPHNRALYFSVSPDQRFAAFGGMDFRNSNRLDVAVLDTSDWRIVRAFPLRGGPSALALFADGRELVAGSFNGTAAVWDLSNGSSRTLTVFPPRDKMAIEAVAGSPDGKLIFAGGTAYCNCPVSPVVVQATDGAPVATFPYAQDIKQAAWDPRGRYLAMLAHDNTLFLWRPTSPAPSYAKVKLPVSSAHFASFAISPDGSHIAASTRNGVIVFSIG